ncbi:MAG: hypothetical protein H6Q53_226 [Deltaproteobacteria bacterium]|nr:hypothetical protein [Deltaproteobacteria bacterium]
MADIQGTNKYEFSENENLALSSLSKNLHQLGVVILVAGLLFVAYLVVSFIDPISLLSLSDTKSTMLGIVDYGIWIVIAILVIYLSITVIRLAGPIGQIVKTRGADMTHLMNFVGDLTSMLRVSFSALIVVCLLLAVSLLLLVLVF